MRRVIHPGQQHHQRAGCGEGFGDAALADIQADQQFSDLEHYGGHGGADPNIAPGDSDRWHELVNHRKQKRGDRQRYRNVDHLDHNFQAGRQARRPGAKSRNAGADDQRHHQQESQPKNKSERQKTRTQNAPDARWLFFFRDMPDAVQRALQFGKNRCGADSDHDKADDACEQPFARIAGTFYQALHGRGTVLTDQPTELGDDLALHRFASKHRACNGDHDDQQRRQRKHRVVGNGSAHAGRKIVDPGHNGHLAHSENTLEIHDRQLQTDVIRFNNKKLQLA